MKILFDYSPAYLEIKTGIPLFVEKIYEELKQDDDIEIVKTHDLRRNFPFSRSRVYSVFEHRLYRRYYIPILLSWGKFDIYIDNQYMFTPIFKPANTTVITFIYDIGLVLFDDINTKVFTRKWRRKLKSSVSNSDVLVTISKSSLRDIKEYLQTNLQENKPLEYIYLDSGIRPCLLNTKIDVPEKFKFDVPYFLFIGTIEPRKNPMNLVKGFKLYKDMYDDPIKLVLAGRRGWMYEEVFEYVESNGLNSDVVFTGYVSEVEKVGLINNASAFLLLSKYEGFGMPVLEALRLGVPTLVSDIEVFRELYESSVLYCNPDDLQEIAIMMRNVVDNPPAISYSNLKKFSWSRSAKKMIEILKKHSS